MTEQQPLVATKSTNPKITRRYNWIWVSICLLGLLLICVVLAMLIKMEWSQITLQKRQLTATLSEQAHTAEQINALLEQIRQQQQTVTSMQQQVRHLGAPMSMQNAWRHLSEVDFQIHLANQYLMVGIVNLPLAQRLLNSALQQLQQINHPLSLPVQSAVKQLLEQLQQIKAIDINTMNMHITNLMRLAEQLAVPEAPPKNSPTHSLADSDQNPALAQSPHWYRREWYALRDYLSEIIVVRHEQKVLMPVSLPQRQLVSSEIRITLLQAQWSMLQQNQLVYQNSLKHCQELLTTYFTSNPLTAKMLPKLQQLAAVNLNPSLPSFASVFTIINTALRQSQQAAVGAQSSPVESQSPASTKAATAPHNTPNGKTSLEKLPRNINSAVEI